MDLSKKRKADENGAAFPAGTPLVDGLSLSPPDVRKILEPFSKDQLLDILQTAVIRDASMLAAVRSVADSDVTQRKLFIRGLGWETTTDKLRSIFSGFGELDEAIVITDKNTGKSKGYGFVTFKHIDGAVLALKEPTKKIDGRMAVAQLAASRDAAGVDVSMRKIYVGNVPFEITPERLLSHFSSYGDIEEGPLGFDKQSGKQKGFAFFVYKTEEGARASLVDPMKNVDGHQLLCKLATDGKKGKPAGGVQQGPPGMTGDAMRPRGPMNSNYGVPGGMPSYGGFSSGPPALSHQNPSPLPSSIAGAQGFGNQAPPSFTGGTGGGYGSGGGTGGGYGSGGGTGGGYGSGGGTGGYGSGAGTGGYGTGGFSAGSQYGGGSGVGEYGGMNNPGSAMYRMPPTSGGYPDGGNYGLLSSAYQNQTHQPPPGPRGPPAGMYQGPPYY